MGRTSSSSSIRSIGRRAEAHACLPSTSASATFRQPIPRYWVSALTAPSATITGRSRSASATIRCSRTFTGPSSKAYGVYWPDWNANVPRDVHRGQAGEDSVHRAVREGGAPRPRQDPRRGSQARLLASAVLRLSLHRCGAGWGEGSRDHAARVRSTHSGWAPSGRTRSAGCMEGTGPATPHPTPPRTGEASPIVRASSGFLLRIDLGGVAPVGSVGNGPRPRWRGRIVVLFADRGAGGEGDAGENEEGADDVPDADAFAE